MTTDNVDNSSSNGGHHKPVSKKESSNESSPITEEETASYSSTSSTSDNNPASSDSLVVTGVSDIVGDFGRWQKIIFSFFFVCGMFSAWNGLALSFYAPEVGYLCKKDDHNSSSSLLSPKAFAVFLEKSSVNDSCYRSDGSECTAWIYNTTESSIITEWDLVCGRSWLVSLAKSSYMFGTLCAVLLSQVADKVGRFPIVFGGVIIEVLAGILSAISPNVSVYLVSRFFLAVGNAARWGSGFVIILEIVGSRYRSDLGIGYEFGWASGYILLPLFAYYVRNFRYLQLLLTIPEVFFIFLCWKYIPESPRWQLTKGRFEAASKSLKKAAAMNGVYDENIDSKLKKLKLKFQADEEETFKRNRSVNVFHLWKFPNLRKKTALLFFTWAVNGFVYYGLSFNTNSLEGDPYINFLLSGAVEIPAYALCMYALTKIGRRTSLVVCMVGAGLAFLLILPFSFVSTQIVWVTTSLAMIGKFFITASFAIIYLYTCEVYPTVVRTVGLGCSSMAARVGAIIAPFVKELGEVTHVTVALTIFGVLAILDAVVLLLFGEETRGRDMPDTMEEGDKVTISTSITVLSSKPEKNGKDHDMVLAN